MLDHFGSMWAAMGTWQSCWFDPKCPCMTASPQLSIFNVQHSGKHKPTICQLKSRSTLATEGHMPRSAISSSPDKRTYPGIAYLIWLQAPRTRTARNLLHAHAKGSAAGQLPQQERMTAFKDPMR